MSDDQPAPLAERIAALNQPAAAAPAEADTPAVPEAAEDAELADAQPDAAATDSVPDEAAPQQPEPDGPASAEPEPAADDASGRGQAPAEGYDFERGAYLKTYSLGTPAALHEMDLGEAAAHHQAAPLAEGAERAARAVGYQPTGPAQLIDVRPNGGKSDLTYAVPADPRDTDTPPTAS